MKIAIVHSGDLASTRPEEQETIEICADIEASFARLGHTSWRVHFTNDLGSVEVALKAQRPDMIFNFVETAMGSDALAYLGPALFESLRIPYTGCSAAALAMAASKPSAKKLMTAIGVPTPDSLDAGGGPWIVKSETEHASLGLTVDNIVETMDDARALICKLSAAGGEWFAERFIDGREYNIYMMPAPDGTGMEVTGFFEIVLRPHPDGKPKIYDYHSKWYDETVDLDHNIPPAVRAVIEKQSAVVWNALNLDGMARLEYRMDRQGVPYLIDINLNPGMGREWVLMSLSPEKNITYDQVIDRLVRAAARKMRDV